VIEVEPERTFVSGAPDAETLGKVLSAAEPLLGRQHEVCQLLVHAMVDPDGVATAWAAIEALPPASRQMLAASLGEILISS
jgi:hypothetical protein